MLSTDNWFANAQRVALAASRQTASASPKGHCGATQESSAVYPRPSTLRISHFPDPHT
jgi:hypothetical protein